MLSDGAIGILEYFELNQHEDEETGKVSIGSDALEQAVGLASRKSHGEGEAIETGFEIGDLRVMRAINVPDANSLVDLKQPLIPERAEKMFDISSILTTTL